MASESNDKILFRIFNEASRLPKESRPEYLESACGNDHKLRDEVSELLSQFESDTHSLSDRFVHGLAYERKPELKLEKGQLVGKYRIVKHLASGGMGSVYLAQRSDGQFDMDVAIKLLDGPELNSEQLSRFQDERNILARLDHPNIPKILDAGSVAVVKDEETHLIPFFAMQYVDGLPITEYCEKHKLSLNQRLKLFVEVCNTVYAVNTNSVLHRDLKPSNILVSAEGSIYLLDFGISSFLQGETESVPEDENRSTILTPSYTAPEIREGNPASMASESYSLGLLLSELVTGELPAALSTQHSVSDEAESRDFGFSSKKKWTKSLKGDLQAILSKSLNQDPSLRYRNANELSMDITRHQRMEPLVGIPTSRSGRVRKFISRHPLGSFLAALSLLALIGSLLLYRSLWQESIDQKEKSQAFGKLAVARELKSSDPSRAGLLLSEISHPELSNSVRSELFEILQGELPFSETLHKGPVGTVSFSPDSAYLATASNDSTVRIISLTGSDSTKVLRHEAAVWAALFSPDGKFVVSSAVDSSIAIWDAATASLLQSINIKGTARTLSMAPGRGYFATSSTTGSVKLIDLESKSIIANFDHPSGVSDVDFDPTGRLLATGSNDGSLHLIDVESGISIFSVERAHPIRDIEISPNGELLAIATEGNYAEVFELIPKTSLYRFEHDRPISKLSFSPDGRSLATASSDGFISIWSTSDGSKTVLPHEGYLRDLEFTTDGNFLLSASDQGSIIIWNLKEPGESHLLRNDSSVRDLSIHPAGKMLAAALWDGRSKMWNIDANKRPSQPLASYNSQRLEDGYTKPVTDSNGRWTMSLVLDNTVRILDSTNGSTRLIQHGVFLSSASFSAKGNFFLTLSGAGEVKIWNLNSDTDPMTLRNIAAIDEASFSENSSFVELKMRDGTTLKKAISLPELNAELADRISTCLDIDFRIQKLGESLKEAQKANRERCL